MLDSYQINKLRQFVKEIESATLIRTVKYYRVFVGNDLVYCSKNFRDCTALREFIKAWVRNPYYNGKTISIIKQEKEIVKEIGCGNAN